MLPIVYHLQGSAYTARMDRSNRPVVRAIVQDAGKATLSAHATVQQVLLQVDLAKGDLQP